MAFFSKLKLNFSLKKCVVTNNFVFGFQKPLLRFCFSHSRKSTFELEGSMLEFLAHADPTNFESDSTSIKYENMRNCS